MSVIKRDRVDLNQVSQTRIQEINEAVKTEESSNVHGSSLSDTVSSSQQKTETVSKQKEDQINMKLPVDVKTKWKLFFVENNINLTQGIMFAVENLIQEVKDGEATVTRGGVFKKK